MNADQVWGVFWWTALWLVAFAGFWGFIGHLTRGGLNWGHHEPPPYPKATDSESEWLDAVEIWKGRRRA